METIEDFAKLSQIMALTEAHFNGNYRIDLCKNDGEFWVSIAPGFDDDYCAEQMGINEALEYMQGIGKF